MFGELTTRFISRCSWEQEISEFSPGAVETAFGRSFRGQIIGLSPTS